MEESGQENEKRYAASQLLTRLINNTEQYPHVRFVVVETLLQLGKRIAQLNNAEDEFSVYEQILNTGTPFASIHFKGDNALDACLNEETDLRKAGTSAWHIQILINPWVPARAQEDFFTHINRIVSDEIDAARMRIAIGLRQDIQNQLQLAEPEELSLPLDPHTIVFFDDESGFFDESRITCDEAKSAENVQDLHLPELNNNTRYQTIQDLTTNLIHSDSEVNEGGERRNNKPKGTPFPSVTADSNTEGTIQFRLAYKWRLQSNAQEDIDVNSHQNNQAFDGRPIATDQHSGTLPLLMKFIDITVPGPNTIKAIMAWSNLEHDQPIIENPQSRDIILPNLDYHLRETITSLCEIADGSCCNADKRGAYEQRFIQIYDSRFSLDTANTSSNVKSKAHTYRKNFYAILDAIAGKPLAKEHGDPRRLINDLMASVEQRSSPPNFIRVTDNGSLNVEPSLLQRCMQGRNKAQSLLSNLHRTAFPELPPLSAAFSDDLALINLIKINPYINIQRFPLSGLEMATLVRIPYEEQIRLDLPKFLWSLDNCSTIKLHQHNTLRQGNISHETTLALFDDTTLTALITLTSADQNEVPFHNFQGDVETCYASLLDMHEQRKAAIALTEDYVILKRMKQQCQLIRHALSINPRPF